MRRKLPALLAALIFQLPAHAAALRLQILDISGAAVPGAVVTLSCQDRPAARVSLPTNGGLVLRIRKASTPEPAHRHIDQRLDIKPEIVRPRKSWSAG